MVTSQDHSHFQCWCCLLLFIVVLHSSTGLFAAQLLEHGIITAKVRCLIPTGANHAKLFALASLWVRPWIPFERHWVWSPVSTAYTSALDAWPLPDVLHLFSLYITLEKHVGNVWFQQKQAMQKELLRLGNLMALVTEVLQEKEEGSATELPVEQPSTGTAVQSEPLADQPSTGTAVQSTN